MFYQTLDFHRVSLTHSLSDRDAERDRTGTKKAKYWDGLEIFYKTDRVEASKVHNLKLATPSGVDV